MYRRPAGEKRVLNCKSWGIIREQRRGRHSIILVVDVKSYHFWEKVILQGYNCTTYYLRIDITYLQLIRLAARRYLSHLEKGRYHTVRQL